MEATVNTFGKFKEYKERRVREFIKKYNCFLGISWGWFIVLFFILLCLAIAWGLTFYVFGGIKRPSITFGFVLIPILIFFIVSFINYKRSLHIQGAIYDCLKNFSDYESQVSSKIELEMLNNQICDIENEIMRLESLIMICDLKCETIEKLRKSNNYNSIPSIILGKSLDKYKRMIKSRNVFLLEKCSYEQAKEKYNTDVSLLRIRYIDLKSRQNNFKDKINISNVLTELDECMKSNLDSHSFLYKSQGNKYKGEIRELFFDLFEIVSQVKIQ